MFKSAVLIVSALSFAGCNAFNGQSSLPIREQADAPVQPFVHSEASSFKQLATFNVTQGANPWAGVIDVSGTLYGTTQLGGDDSCFGGYSTPGCGTVFEVTPSGTEKAIHNFQGAPDGAISFAPLIDVHGTLYGTTYEGGNSNCNPSSNVPGCGTVFEITPSGKESILHSFGPGNDGATPSQGSSLIFVKGALYGVTYDGGTAGVGTIFKVTLAGKESVLFNFQGGAPGAYPKNLIFVNSAFYGVASNSTGPYSKHYGMFFKVTMAGKETVLYDFKGPPDGTDGFGNLVASGDTIYGTTLGGGIDKCAPYDGCGTVFSITTAGKEKILYRFDPGKKDGVEPYGGLTLAHGALYGTACCAGPNGGGTVFKVTTSGKESILYGFEDKGKDGANPYDTPIILNNTLFGTTGYGGDVSKTAQYGYGTVFSITL